LGLVLHGKGWHVKKERAIENSTFRDDCGQLKTDLGNSSLATRTSRKALNPNGFKAFWFFKSIANTQKTLKNAQKHAPLWQSAQNP